MFSNFSVNTGYGLPVPHTTSISQLQPGTQIHVVGTPTGNRFEINLKNYQDDVVLHFNPRFDSNSIVLNTAQRGSWAQEERHSLQFYRGTRVTIIITVTHTGFSISANNMRVAEFQQRVPLYSAQLLEVKGDIQLESAQVYAGDFGGSMGMNFPGMNFPGMNVSFTSAPNPSAFGGMNPSFGYPSAPPAGPMPPFGGMGGNVPSIHSCRIHTGSRIFVRGYIHQNPNRFELNLLQGFNDTDDVAFHFNPRFDQRQIVKNYRRAGSWGNEENQPFPAYMSLVPGAQIELQIACLPDRYTVYMNNQLIAEYSHKIPPGAVMALQYKGDITVTSVGQL